MTDDRTDNTTDNTTGNTDSPGADPGPATKNPNDWTTGDEPMTGPQRSYLHTLTQQAGEQPPPDNLSKADASKLIDELQERTGRGQ
jgi:hypothetical protein